MRKIELAYLLTLALCGAAMSSCTSIPTAQAEKFDAAMKAAKEAGEEVLVDYSSIRDEAQAVAALSAPDPNAALVFDPSTVQPSAIANRDVIERTRAWEALAKYSSALNAVATGQNQGQLAEQANGLLRSLTSVSGATLPPGVGAVVKEAAGLVQGEMRARRFAEAITVADPKMGEITDAMIADTGNFWGIRLVLYNRAADAFTDPVGDRLNRFDEVAGPVAYPYDPNDTTPDPKSFTALVRRLNEASKALNPNMPDSDHLDPPVPPTGTGNYTPEVAEHLLQIVTEAENAAEEKAKLDAKLEAYRETLTAYVQLLLEMRAAHASMLAAISANSVPTVEVVDTLLDSAIRVRTSLKSSN